MLEGAAPLNVRLYARDLAATRRFYATVLGLPLWHEEPDEVLHFGVGGTVLSIHRADSEDLPPRGVGIAFTVRSGLDDLCATLDRAGIVFELPVAERPFGRSAMFRDPDGYELWICQPSATETQFQRWRLEDRDRSRRRPVQRRAKPRPHQRAPASHRERHPEG